MTIYLHIGLNKTGTTSIQAFCYKNHNILKELGLIYPISNIYDSAHKGMSKHFIGSPSAHGNHADIDDLSKHLQEAVAEKKDILLSSEFFFTTRQIHLVKQIKEYLVQFDPNIKIIIYLRRHDLWIASLYNQQLKNKPSGKTSIMDIRDFFIFLLSGQTFNINFSEILAIWANVFGANNLIVKSFERSQFYMGDYIWDFLHCINPSIPDQLIKREVQTFVTNDSIPKDIAELIVHIRLANIDEKSQRQIIAILLRATRKNPDLPVVYDHKLMDLSLETRQMIVNYFQKDYKKVGALYRHADDTPLFKDPVV